jgi:lysophospholipase
VTAFDWRGQGGSGRFLADPLVGHVTDFAAWVDDFAGLADAWARRAAGPRVVMGHSMGGHLILRALVERRIAPDAAVLVAPMLGFETAGLPLGLAASLVKLAALIVPERSAWKGNERPGAARQSRQVFLTHDVDRYADELWWKEEKPELALGPPSLRWLAQAYASCVRLEAAGAVEHIATPMLILGTEGDRLVSPAAIPCLAARLPNAKLKMFGAEVAHEILRERDGPRDEALAEIDAFLETVRAPA